MPLDPKHVLAEIDGVLGEYGVMRRASTQDDCRDLGDVRVTRMITVLAAAIDRLAPPGSAYQSSKATTLKGYGPTHPYCVVLLVGILSALRDDIAAGRLRTMAEVLHADLFGDFLDMANHLLEEGFKDPAAVLGGGVLEEHLRKLSNKHSLSTTLPDGRAKKADAMNAELAGTGAISKSDQKNVTAWLAIRSSAAHAKYGEYTREQVSLLLQSVRDFVTRVPA